MNIKYFAVQSLLNQFLIVAFAFSQTNCNTNIKNKQQATAYIVLDSNISRKGVFIGNSSRFQYDYIFVQNDVKRGNFTSLVNGYDSLAIRLWYVYYGPQTQVVEIRNDNNGWGAEFSTIKRHIDDKTNDTIVEILRHRVVRNPKSGWDLFINKIRELNILEMRSGDEIEEYPSVSDGDFVTLEVASRKYYYLKSYSTPMANTNIKEVKALEDLMQLIEEEFGEKQIKKI